MTRTMRILVCLGGLAALQGMAAAEDTWTAPLGRYTRVLAEQRRAEAAMAMEFPDRHIAFDPSLENPYYVVQDYHRLPHVYLDRRRFFYNRGNLRIDYRSLSGLPDQRRFYWTPFDDAEWSAHAYRNGGRRGRRGERGPYGRGGSYHDYGHVTSGLQQVVPYEMMDSRPSYHYHGRGRGPRTHGLRRP